jgi:hypothetical protein
MSVEQFVDVGREANAVVEGAQLAPGEWLDVAGFDQCARAILHAATGDGAALVRVQRRQMKMCSAHSLAFIFRGLAKKHRSYIIDILCKTFLPCSNV